MYSQFMTWLEGSTLGHLMRDTGVWTYAVVNLTHILGVASLFGAILVLDLRMLGVAKGLPVRPLERLVPWGIFGFVINLVSGLVFIVGAPDQYASNPAFYFKLMFLVIAGLNALYFETQHGKHVLELGHMDSPPASLKVAGALVILILVLLIRPQGVLGKKQRIG